MSNFYGNSGGGGGNDFYNGGGYGQQQQQQQYQQQQPAAQNYNYSQWSQQPQQASQQPSHQQQSTAAPGPAPSAFWNPGTMMGLAAQAASGGMNEQAVMNMTQAIWKSGSASIIPGVDSTMLMLRSYFAVDNNYVKRKMFKILLPFLSKSWKRMQNAPGADASSVSYALPNVDENAPDLYIPSMSLITYCLMCAFCYGAAGDFSPEVLPDIISKCFITQIAEVLLIRLGFYLMQASVPLLDLFAYTGYKYLGLSINMSLGMIAGTLGYGTKGFYLAFLWTASAAAYFMLKTMAHNIPTVVSNTGPKREFMVIGFAVSQAASMWFVSQTKFL